jgi:hypothetical protein
MRVLRRVVRLIGEKCQRQDLIPDSQFAITGGVANLPDRVAREAYSQEISSCGFWPGGGPIAYPAFYSYAYPEPEGFAKALIRPAAAFYSSDLREFILPYDEVRNAKSPDDILLDFLQTTYEAEASLAKWDRATLEGIRHL